MSDDQILTVERVKLGSDFFDVRDRFKIVEGLLKQERSSLSWLKFYGRVEREEYKFDLVAFENLLNDVARKSKVKTNLFSHNSNKLFNSLDESQINLLALHLLRILIN